MMIKIEVKMNLVLNRYRMKKKWKINRVNQIIPRKSFIKVNFKKVCILFQKKVKNLWIQLIYIKNR